jgi:hypothetical protein
MDTIGTRDAQAYNCLKLVVTKTNRDVLAVAESGKLGR